MTKREYKELLEKRQILLPNIHLCKGKYPQSSEEPLHFSTTSDISHISEVYADKPNQ